MSPYCSFYLLINFTSAFIEVGLTHNITWVSSVQHSDPTTLLCRAHGKSRQHQSPNNDYNIIGPIPYAVIFIPTTYLSNAGSLYLSFIILSSPSESTPRPRQPPVCCLYLKVCPCFVCFFYFLDSTGKWNYMVSVFLCLTYLTSHYTL